MESFQPVSAGRVTLAVGTPCLRNRVILVRGTTFVNGQLFGPAHAQSKLFIKNDINKQKTKYFEEKTEYSRPYAFLNIIL
jgi:hypothetical protein